MALFFSNNVDLIFRNKWQIASIVKMVYLLNQIEIITDNVWSLNNYEIMAIKWTPDYLLKLFVEPWIEDR